SGDDRLEGNYSNEASGTPYNEVPITFILDAGKNSISYKSISIGGTFNNWSVNEDTLQHIGSGKWKITKYLMPTTTIEYKFIINEQTWERDKLFRISYYDANGTATTVYIAGTFNGWNTTATPMKKIDAHNWIIDLPVSNGTEYKFVIDGNWEGGGNRIVSGATPNRYLKIPGYADTIYCNWNDTPAAPDLKLVAGNNVIYVSWTSQDSDVLDTGYRLYKSKYQDTGFVLIDYKNQYYNYADTDVKQGETYYYYMMAIDSTDSELQSETSIIQSITPGYLSKAKFILYAGYNPQVLKITIAGEFNNWNKTANELIYDSNGVWIGEVDNIVINKEYKYKYIYNTENWENISDRYNVIKEVNIDNWEYTPDKPIVSAKAELSRIMITISTSDIDIKEYTLYRNDTIYQIITSSEFSTVLYDTNISEGATYTYKVVAKDWYGAQSEYSEIVSVEAGKQVELKFFVDMNSVIYEGKKIEYGVQIAGSIEPLNFDKPIKNKMTLTENNVYEKTINFMTGQTLKYYYVYNAGTSKETKEKYNYTFSLYAPQATSVKLMGIKGWTDNDALIMTKDSSGTWTYTIQLEPGEYEYKYKINDVWENLSDGGNRKLELYRTISITNNKVIFDVFNQFDGVSTKISSPKGLVSISFNNKIMLDWEDIREHCILNQYRIYKGNSNTNLNYLDFSYISGYTDTNFISSDTNPYYYYVVAVDSNGVISDASEIIEAKLATTNKVRLSKNNIVDLETDQSTITKQKIRNFRINTKSEIRYYSFYKEIYRSYLQIINTANSKLSNIEKIHFLDNNNIDSYIYSVELINENNEEVHQFDSAITITFSIDTPTFNANYTAGDLKIYVLNTQDYVWEMIREPVIVNNTKKTISTTRYNNSIYIIVRTDTTPIGITSVLVYPNPIYYYDSIDKVVNFINLPANLECIKIFTINAEQVSEIRNYINLGVNMNAKWDCRNDNGELVASGIYIYYIKTGSGVLTGKIGVIK
ncbi:MAG TPA: hypothetical protein PKX90_01470, partial [bacterium]|nr:hypothetical protein [bacterium]